jgi:Tol biopolymer transport system component
MTEAGESVKRLTEYGFNPAWSPDGKEIVCTENRGEGSGQYCPKSSMDS